MNMAKKKLVKKVRAPFVFSVPRGIQKEADRLGVLLGADPDMVRGGAVNHPTHYNDHPSGVEAIDIIEEFPFNIGTAIKYLWRCGLKEAPMRELKKARWYVEREIQRRERHGLDQLLKDIKAAPAKPKRAYRRKKKVARRAN
jgi:Protein of unknwon function (DUF3310)